jgi:hypothetical protein
MFLWINVDKSLCGTKVQRAARFEEDLVTSRSAALRWRSA